MDRAANGGEAAGWNDGDTFDAEETDRACDCGVVRTGAVGGNRCGSLG